MDCSTRKGRKVKGGKNRDKKIVVVKFIIQKTKIKQVQQQQKVQSAQYHSGLIPFASNSGIGTWYSGLCGEGCCPSCWMTWGGHNWRAFFFLSFLFFLLFLVFWAFCCKQEL
jgi:hypothetical protein